MTSVWFRALAVAAAASIVGSGTPSVRAAEQPAAAARAASADTAPVDLNSATVDDLVKVPGIGEALATRIVEFRTKNGPFERVDDLLKVRGIGEKSLEKLRPHLRAGGRK